MRKIVLCFVAVVCFILGLGTVSASADYENEIFYNINYEDEWVEIGSDLPVYYQVAKEDQRTGFNAGKWMPTVMDGDGWQFIDFAATSNTKSVYYALTTDPEGTTAEEIVEIEVKIKTLKVELDYRVEEYKGYGISEFINKLTIKGMDASDDVVTESKDIMDCYYYQWRRSTNNAWKSDQKFDQFTWDLLRGTQGTFYLRIYGEYDTSLKDEVYFRPSKEAKIKMPKIAKAPTVKFDYVKSTVALKNGMQVRAVDSSGSRYDWCTIPQYDKTAKYSDIWGADVYDTTSTKVSKVDLWDMVDVLNKSIGRTKFSAGEKVAIEVRTAATTKKLPSAVSYIEFDMPAYCPALDSVYADCTEADSDLKIKAKLVIDFEDLFKDKGVEYGEYEYILGWSDAKSAHTSTEYNKWTKFPANGILDLSNKVGKTYAVCMKDGSDKTIKYEETNVIYVRQAADAKKKRFPGEYEYAWVHITKVVPE